MLVPGLCKSWTFSSPESCFLFAVFALKVIIFSQFFAKIVKIAKNADIFRALSNSSNTAFLRFSDFSNFSQILQLRANLMCDETLLVVVNGRKKNGYELAILTYYQFLILKCGFGIEKEAGHSRNGPLDYAVGFGFWRCQTHLNWWRDITEKSLSLGTAILITEVHEHAQKVGHCVNEVRVIGQNYWKSLVVKKNTVQGSKWNWLNSVWIAYST